MIKNFSQILNEEPINMCRNQPEETKNYKMIQNSQEKSFKSYLSNTKFSYDNRDGVQNSKYFKEFLILTSESEMISKRYQHLYQMITLSHQNPQEFNDVMEILVKVVKNLTKRSPMLADIIFLMTQSVNNQGKGLEYLDSVLTFLNSSQYETISSKSAYNNTNTVQQEIVNMPKPSELKYHNKSKKYPSKSVKLHDFLKQNKKSNQES